MLTMRHDGGAKRRVDFLGLYGQPLRAWIRWSLAGDYPVSIRSGRIVATGDGARSDRGIALRCWKLDGRSHAHVRRQYGQWRKDQAIPVAETQEEL